MFDQLRVKQGDGIPTNLCLKIIILILRFFNTYSSELKTLTDLCSNDHQESLLQIELQQPTQCMVFGERKSQFHWI